MLIDYDPHPDGQPDPGEVVWVWIPYEEDPNQGKDRPALIIARAGDTLTVLQLTSEDHDLDVEQEAREGRFWMDIGTGSWDSHGRPSEVRTNRLIEVSAADVRREGAVLDAERFAQVAAEVQRHNTPPTPAK